MNEYNDQPVGVDVLNSWLRQANRFFPGNDAVIETEPAPCLRIGEYEIRTNHDWTDFWFNEIYANHLDEKLSELMSPSKPQSFSDILKKLDNIDKNKNRKKKKDDE